MPTAPSSLAADVRRGLAASIPVNVAVAPVGALFGALAVQKGLTVGDAALMSATAYAGASQLVAVDLFGRHVPAWSILLSVLAINFRHVLYSAALAPMMRHMSAASKAGAFFLMVDPAFAFAQSEVETRKAFSAAAFFAYSGFMWCCWLAATLAGAAFGRLIAHPERWALDMLFPIYFLALVMTFRTRPVFWRTVAVSGIVSTLIYHGPGLGLPFGPPWHVTLGGLAGILVAAFAARPGETVAEAAREEIAPAEGRRA